MRFAGRRRLRKAVRVWSFSFEVFANDAESGKERDEDAGHQCDGLQPWVYIAGYGGDQATDRRGDADREFFRELQVVERVHAGAVMSESSISTLAVKPPSDSTMPSNSGKSFGVSGGFPRSGVVMI